MRIFFPALFFSAFLFSCATQENIHADFERDFKKYNELLRWHHFEDAGRFPAEAISGQFMERVKAAKNVAVVEYRVVSVRYNKEKKDAEVKVEIDYYLLSSGRIKTLVDTQKWAYLGKEGAGAWKLMSLFPEFP